MVSAAHRKGSLNEKLDLIIKNQDKILANERKILGEEEKILDEERNLKELEKEDLANDRREEDSLQELLRLEKELKTEVSHPLKRVTKQDLFKGMIGAFVGILGHFAFSKGADIAVTLSAWRSTVLYLTAFGILLIMLYYTGFKKVQKHLVLKFMPLRALVLYCASIFAIVIIYLLFGKINSGTGFYEVYNLIGASIVLAALGAGTADLIGNND